MTYLGKANKGQVPTWRWWLALLVFGIAMGALEGIVVVYLRELYYSLGFDFPLAPMPRRIYLAELAREACTLLMLGGLAALSARGFLRQFAVFVWSFAIWDLAYYATLKLALDWPASWWTWDILFLIPIPWVGPVLAPVLYCVVMAAAGAGAWRLSEKDRFFNARELVLIGISICAALYAFMEEPFQVIAEAVRLEPDRSRHTELAAEAFQAYVPSAFNWLVFVGSLLAGALAASLMWMRARKRVSTAT